MVEFAFDQLVRPERWFAYKSEVTQDERFWRGPVINILKGF